MTREEWDGYSVDDQFRLFQLAEERDNALNRLLHAIPECPAHGHGCIPHAHEWVEAQKTSVPTPEKPNLLAFERVVTHVLDKTLTEVFGE